MLQLDTQYSPAPVHIVIDAFIRKQTAARRVKSIPSPLNYTPHDDIDSHIINQSRRRVRVTCIETNQLQ